MFFLAIILPFLYCFGFNLNLFEKIISEIFDRIIDVYIIDGVEANLARCTILLHLVLITLLVEVLD